MEIEHAKDGPRTRFEDMNQGRSAVAYLRQRHYHARFV